jgi:hypothetical protein
MTRLGILTTDNPAVTSFVIGGGLLEFFDGDKFCDGDWFE